VIRPRDEFQAEDTFLGVQEKSNPDRPYRLFAERGQRKFYNQKKELVVVVTSTILVKAQYPEDKVSADSPKDFTQARRHRYTAEELDYIHSCYDADLLGTYRQGSAVRYWDDVDVGDELHPVVKGPYDYSDAASFFGVTGYSMAFSKKWASLREGLKACKVDNETGEVHANPDWHFSDDIARQKGVPFAPIFGTHIETSFSHLICNWMGDAGRLKMISSQIRVMSFMGDTFVCKAKIVRKYKENGECLVDLDCWAENFITGIVCATASATVRLVEKEN
jgi:hypothetical protein